MTDNGVSVSQDGSEAVRCDRSDGLGIGRLRAAGVPVLVLSSETNAVVAARCRKLRVECLHGVADKRAALLVWLDANSIDPANVVYVGNDTNDLGCLRTVGCGAVVADAHPDVVDAARLVLARDGGHGAVREICDLVAESLGVALVQTVSNYPAMTRRAG
jgi:N-acylneuraminate cytidylyltransferase